MIRKSFASPLFLIMLLSLLPLVGIFSKNELFHTHDGLVHLSRIGAFYKALLDFHIPVRWAGDLNYGYGMPIFNFIYHLPYIIASFFIFLGLGLVNAFKVSLALSYILSGVFMFLFAKEFFNPSADGEKKAFLIAVFYQFAPFRFIELLLRGSFGEVYTYAFLPLVLYCLVCLLKKQTALYVTLTAVATALLVLSHNSISLVFFAAIVLFLLFFSKNKKELLYGGFALGLGLLLSAYYWLPAILEHKYTYGNLFMQDLFRNHFAPIQNFFIPNITNNKALQIEGISVQLGLFHVLALFAAIYFLLRQRKQLKKNEARMIVFCLLLVATAFFFMLPISKPFWERIDFLRQFQFPWRFLSVTTFATSLLAVSYFHFPWFKNQKAYFAVVVLTIVTTIIFWIPQLGYDKIDERKYWNFPLTTTYYGETDVIWSAGPAQTYPKKQIEVIKGDAVVTDITKKTHWHTFTIDAKTDVILVDHTQYFPGWRVYTDSSVIPIQFQDPRHRGELEFAIPKGKHSIRVQFGESKIRLLADFLSVGAIILLLLVWSSQKTLLRHEK